MFTIQVRFTKQINKISRKKKEILTKKIPYTLGLVTVIVLNTKISEFKNKIRDTSSLMTTIGRGDNSIPDHAKCITTK